MHLSCAYSCCVSAPVMQQAARLTLPVPRPPPSPRLRPPPRPSSPPVAFSLRRPTLGFTSLRHSPCASKLVACVLPSSAGSPCCAASRLARPSIQVTLPMRILFSPLVPNDTWPWPLPPPRPSRRLQPLGGRSPFLSLLIDPITAGGPALGPPLLLDIRCRLLDLDRPFLLTPLTLPIPSLFLAS